MARLFHSIDFASLPMPRVTVSPMVVRSVAWMVAAIVVGWVLANWFWQITVPEEEMRFESAELPDHATAAKRVSARHLFGRASSSGDGAEGASGEVNFKVTGAMTGSPVRAGFAIIAEQGKPSMAVVEGETFQPGVTLAEILPGKVRLKIGERMETIEVVPQTPGEAGLPGGISMAPPPSPEMASPPAPQVPPQSGPRPEASPAEQAVR